MSTLALSTPVDDPERVSACTSPVPRGRVLAWLTFGIVALTGACYWLTLRTGHDWGDDFCLYILHARNLADGKPYAATGYVYNPHLASLSPRTYPPGLPLLLAPIYAVFGLNLQAMKATLIACFVLFLFVFDRLARQRREGHSTDSALTRVALLVLVAACPTFWAFKDRILSEIPFLLLTSATLLALERTITASHVRAQAIWAVLAGLAIAAAVATRSIGIVLLPAAIGQELVLRRRIGVRSIFVIASFAVVWSAVRLLIPPDGSYFDQLHFTPDLYLRNARNLLGSLGDVLDGGNALGRRVLLIAVVLLGLLGFLTRVRRHPLAMEWYVALSLAAIVIWPASEGGLRFLLPLLPFLAMYTIEGVQHLGDRFGRWGRPALGGLLGLTVAFSFLNQYRSLELGPLAEGVGQPAARRLFDHLRESTPSNAVIVFPKPRAVALFADRAALAPHHASDDAALLAFWRQNHVSHVVLARDFATTHAFLPKLVERNADFLIPVHLSDEFRVFRLLADSEPTFADQRTGQ